MPTADMCRSMFSGLLGWRWGGHAQGLQCPSTPPDRPVLGFKIRAMIGDNGAYLPFSMNCRNDENWRKTAQ